MRRRHDAVIGGDDQDDDVGDIRAARAHGGEGFVARGVEESDGLVAALDRVGADVLGDAARFARGDVRLADGVEQRGLAVIDMAHEGDDRRTRLQLGGRDRLGLGRLDDLDRRMDLARAFFALFDLEGEAELGAKLAGDLFFQGLVGAGENVHLHQVMDDLVGLEPELGRQILDDDRRLDDDDFVAKLLGGQGGFVRSGRKRCPRAFRGLGHGSRRAAVQPERERACARSRLGSGAAALPTLFSAMRCSEAVKTWRLGFGAGAGAIRPWRLRRVFPSSSSAA